MSGTSSTVRAASTAPTTEPVRKKPRLMIAGEFSAGKTQLINGLLGETVLPSNVTSTSLPPIWLTGAGDVLQRIDLDGKAHDIASLSEVKVDDTAFCVMSHPSPFLDAFDIIDTPGNSDPNIPAESWERMLGFADAVIWCSNATQAWRQSEKAVWTEMPEHLVRTSLMVITHSDRMPDEKSADRVLRRVRRDAADYFSSFIMASLLNPKHVASARAHVESLYAAMGDLPGAPEPLVDGLSGTPAPRTGRTGKAKGADTGSREKPQAEIKPFKRPKTRQSVARTKKAPVSPARQIWLDVTMGSDPASADAFKACVETMIQRVDDLLDQKANDTGSDDLKDRNSIPNTSAPEKGRRKTSKK